jgi:DNA-directed RNA polymerase specialized sigma24 family protein
VHRELVDRAKLGDEEAFDALARTVGDRCMSIASRILRDRDLAQDAVQSALILAWRDLRTLRDPDRFEAWLHRILTNECYAEARRRKRWSASIRLLPVDGPVMARDSSPWTTATSSSVPSGG